MPRKPDIIETSIFSQLISEQFLKIEEVELGPINLEEVTKKKNTKPAKPTINNFKQGDLLIPSNGIKNAFYFQMNMKLSDNYNYKVANSAERTYFFKRIKDSRTSVQNYSDIEDIMHEKYDYDKDAEKNPGTRIA